LRVRDDRVTPSVGADSRGTVLTHITRKTPDAAEPLEVTLERSSRTLVTFLNPVSYHLLRGQPEVLDPFDRIFVDGILLVKMLEWARVKTTRRTSFDMTSAAPILFRWCIERRKSTYFVGSRRTEIDNFIGVVSREFPGLEIRGHRDGYFPHAQWRDVARSIVALRPDVVVVGMGTPRQEQFMAVLSEVDPGWQGMAFSCGGFFHQTQDRLFYYPGWVDRLHLRMPYRILRERLYRRLPLYPRFVGGFLRDLAALRGHHSRSS
jgi:N-acetylglucosaminyldiphosphoundecaprenol N-acetyl-beta-D-mannosaminyltransferase